MPHAAVSDRIRGTTDDPALKRARILICDDREANVMLLERMLELAGYVNVIGTTDGERLIELCAESPPDLILLDLHMPYPDGFEVMRRLERFLQGPWLPILVLTADVTSETKRHALSAGARDFVTKPFDQTEVLLRIANLLETRFLHLALHEDNRRLDFERRLVRSLFARFVSDQVVEEVLDRSGGNVRLGGVRMISTVLFSDLRGFTAFAESLPPERVIEILNRYLTAMSDAILDHGGTLVAYMGDGIMAVFGAPVRYDDHADRALAAACEMLRRLEDFNAWLRHEGLHESGFKMGIGLNSGPVMSGIVGSERRLEYTAIGDTTNTAARMEAMTKGTPFQLFVTQAAHDLLGSGAEDLVFVDDLPIRGRATTVRVWGL
jgi:adenylate cyclase